VTSNQPIIHDTHLGTPLLEIAAKPLQIETWLLFTAYSNFSLRYPTVPSTALCYVPFSHNT